MLGIERTRGNLYASPLACSCMAERLAGQRTFVTGAASGIGLAISERYVDEGAKVAMVDVDADRLEDEAAAIDGETLAVEADVRDTGQVEAAVERTVDAWGGIDVVVNNAGTITRGELVDTADEDIERVVDVNLHGVLRVARATIPALKDGGGSMINTSSVVSVTASRNRSVYTATKGGVKSLTHQLALELGPDVRVNAIAPGLVETPFSEAIWRDEDAADHKRSGIPLERFASPEEVAGPAAFLASEDASYVTGHTLLVDGGQAIS